MTTHMNKNTRIRMNAIWAVIMALIVVGVLLTGCQPSNGDPSDTAGKPGTTTKAADPGVPTAKDSVIIANSSEPTAFFCQDSTIVTSNAKDGMMLAQIYETLFYFDYDGIIKPRIATDYTVSDDGLEYVVGIRDDVTFHNGEKMTIEDVAFTFTLCLEKNKTHSGTMLVNMKSCEVVDDNHVKFTLSAPFAAFINNLTTRPGNIISKKYYEEVGTEGYNEFPIGTGPYKYVSRTSGQKLVLEAYEGYREGPAPIKYVYIHPISNVSTQFISLKSGDIDVINAADTASCLQIEADSIATWVSAIAGAMDVMRLNTRPACGSVLKDDKNLRLAIYSAINKEEILYGAASNYGVILDSDALSWYTGQPADGTYTTIPYDVEKAKEYLAKSSYDGALLKAVVQSGTREEKIMQIIQGQFYNIGINIDIVAADNATVTASWNAGDYDLLLRSETSSLADVSSINTNFGTNATRGANFDEAEQAWFDDKIDQIRQEPDEETRKSIVAEVHSRINENAYTVPLINPMGTIAYNKGLVGITMNPLGFYWINDWSWQS